jgi:hypothetical protein
MPSGSATSIGSTRRSLIYRNKFGEHTLRVVTTPPRPLRAVRFVPIAGPPVLVCPNQRTYSDTVQVENEPRAGARICA